MTAVFEEYFRMRPEDLPFAVPNDLASEPGYFRFGDATCFGRADGIAVSPSAADPLADAAQHVRSDNGTLAMPFDPALVVDTLRDEAYLPAKAINPMDNVSKRAIRQAYYLIRPLMPVSVRRHLQRRALADWKDIPFPDWPLDCSVESILKTTLRLVLKERNERPLPFIWFWPDGLRACVVITHDVETDAGQKFCPELMSINEEFGFRSSFQFVPEQRYTLREDVHAAVRDRGHEINLHGLNHDGKLFEEHGEFLRRAKKINEYAQAWGAKGFRSPILYRRQEWFSELAFEYDMTVPNTARLEAQRGGCCTVMPYFIGNLVELPVTTAEDYTLYQILQDYTTDVWRRQVDRILLEHGIVNVLTHPDYLIEPRGRDTYRKFLGELRERVDTDELWAPLPRDAAAWWRARSQMRIAGREGSWHVEGDDDGRARVAYAWLDGDRVVFDVP